MRLRSLLLAVVLVSATPAGADLPPGGWPQSRCDPAHTGRSAEDALPAVTLGWTRDTGGPLAGEPVVAGCSVFVTSSTGAVMALNREDGSVQWTAPPSYAIAPTVVSSDLAVDAAGSLLAGLPADPAIALLWDAITTLRTAIESYSVDNGFYPAGPDLEPDLVPLYLRSMPANPLAGRPMVASATPSPGDYRYERSAPSGFYLGIWWTDGRFLRAVDGCSGPAPAPTWPLSPETGGRPTALDAASGGVAWSELALGPATDLVPNDTPLGVLWASSEESFLPPDRPRIGRLRATALDGTEIWQALEWAPIRGGAAVDVALGRAVVSRGPSLFAAYVNTVVRTLGIAVESYLVDNGFVPPTGELAPFVVPVYLRCMPRHPLADRPLIWSPTPTTGAYDYQRLASSSYEVAFWDETGARVAIFRDGSFLSFAQDRPPVVEAYDLAGALLWRTPLGTATEDLTPPVYRTADDAVLVGTSPGDLVVIDATTGAERGRTPVGGALSRAPALRADGVTVVATDGGDVVAVAPSGGVLWRFPAGVPLQAAPTVTADHVTYAALSDGTLHAIDPGGGSLWWLPVGGSGRAALTTSAVPSGGWLYVGRSDGVVVGLAPAATGGRPLDLGNVLRAVEQGPDVAFSWTGAPPPCGVRIRRSTDPVPAPGDLLVAEVPPGLPVDAGAVTTGPSRLYYRLRALSCCAALEGP